MMTLKSLSIKALAVMGILATAGIASAGTGGANITYPYTAYTSGCVAPTGSINCSLLSSNYGTYLNSEWTCTYNRISGNLVSGPNVGYNCVVSQNGGCCNILSAGTCPTITCPGSH